MIALPWKKLCANFILPCGENHYGFFLRCPTSFYNQPEELQQKCEEENLHLIDEDVIALAQKFNVEPRKLLSHVLEYKLVWPENIAKDYD